MPFGASKDLRVGVRDINDSDRSDGAPAGLLSCPVTALAVSGRLLFAGHGNELLIFDLETSTLIKKRRVLHAQALHGLLVQRTSSSELILLTWGGKYVNGFKLTILSPDELDAEIPGGPNNISTSKGPSASQTGPSSLTVHLEEIASTSLPDWIFDAAFQPIEDQDKSQSYHIILLSAHNTLHHLSIDFSTPTWAQIPLVIDNAPRCSLYTGRLRWLSNHHLLIAAGTAFGELVVWSCHVNPASSGLGVMAIETHCFFMAHDGSIFGIDVCRTAIAEGSPEPGLLVATCSDDRTIRLWDVSIALGHVPRTSRKTEQEDLPLVPCIARTWAHASRIWKVVFQPSRGQASDLPYLISVGEDATGQVWTIGKTSAELVADERLMITKTAMFSNHSGKNIWSLATSRHENDVFEIYTGGADGSIIQPCIPTCSVSGHANPPELNLKDIRTTLEDKLISSPHTTNDRITSYVWNSVNSLLVFTSAGSMLLGSLRGERHDSARLWWDEVARIENIGSYCLASRVGDDGDVIFANALGKICLFDGTTKTVTQIFNLHGKPAGMSAQYVYDRPICGGEHMREKENKRASVFLATSKMGSPTSELLVLEKDQEIAAFSILRHFEVPLKAVVPVTAMHVVKTSETTHLVLLGLKNGHLVIQPINSKNSIIRGQASSEESVSFHHPHTDAITSLTLIPNHEERTEGAERYLLSTARDSSFAIWRLHHAEGLTSLSLVHRGFPPFGPNIEGASINEDTGQLVLYGFRSERFVVFDEPNQKELHSIQCGGAHRVWSYQPSNPKNAGSFAWTRAGNLNYHVFARSSSRPIRSGGHGREIKACAVSSLLSVKGCQEHRLVATGAEDTDIRLFEIQDNKATREAALRCVGILRRHNTGIQHLQWSEDGRWLFSSAGSEEFFIWRIQPAPLIRVGSFCEAVLPPASELPDLRITSFHARSCDPAPNATDEQKMDASAFLIALAFSDSTTRVYRYERWRSGHAWELVWDDHYTTCCLTQMELVDLKFDEGNQQFRQDLSIIAAATDGNIIVWSSPLLGTPSAGFEQSGLIPYSTFKIHQSSIKALCTTAITYDGGAGHAHLIVTAGDDNALGFTLLDASNAKLTRSGALVVPKAHAAAINAVTVVPSSAKVGAVKHYRVVTASNDQRVKVWDVVVDIRESNQDTFMDVRLVSNSFTPVADVADMCVFRETSESGHGDFKREDDVAVLICGVGIDLVTIPSD